jgi:uncharacterized protein YkwD
MGTTVRLMLAPVILTATFVASGFPASASPDEQLSLEQQMLDLTNAVRQASGCPPLRLSPQLNEAAMRHSEDMAANDHFDHAGTDGSSHIARAAEAGYPGRYVGENIAAGNATPEDTLAQWMDSDSHRANVLDCSFTELGVGYAENESSAFTYYWSQELGKPT